MADKQQHKGVSGAELARREAQSQAAQAQQNGHASTQEDQERKVKAQEMADRIDAVNLDEVGVNTIPVKLRFRHPADEQGVRRVDVRRVDLVIDVPAEYQVEALKVAAAIKKVPSTEEGSLQVMTLTAAIVLKQWQLTPGEEAMTLADLYFGFDYLRLSKLFTVFFK